MYDSSDYVIYYLGASYTMEQHYTETGKMIWKTAWFHCIKLCDKALLMLIDIKRKEDYGTKEQ